MAPGLDRLQHIVVLMMENRSFDHMLGGLTASNPKIDGIQPGLSNPDTSPAARPVPPQPLADFQAQLDPDPDHHFPAVDLQIFGGDTSTNRVANMQGFVKSYFNQRRDLNHSQKIMYYFPPDKLPVLTTLATEFAVFNRWFASIPGPTICNRAFAHYGTSFGRVDMNLVYVNEPFKSIYNRLISAKPKHTAKLYYYDATSSTMEITNLALEYAVFNRWFSSIPGPTLCNRAFAHYGTSFGHVSMELFYAGKQYKSIYERLKAANSTARVYYFDTASSSLEVPNLLTNQPEFFGTFTDFLQDCDNDRLPAYSFIEPNYTDHADASGATWIASDQHPDHHVREGERFIATIYNKIRRNPVLWPKTAILLVYDEHGGIYDHVPPPAVIPDGFVAQPAATGTGEEFHFDRLGVRVPAILISPWIAKGTVVNGRVFEHASIPATVTDWQIGLLNDRSPREKNSETFLDLLRLTAMRTDCIEFNLH